ncbi:MAG: sigma-70 family RNA polymerase sigma factor [Bacteroidia bacterium]
MTKQLSDQQLVDQYVNGNEEAIAELISRHKRRIFSYIMMVVKDKQLAEDVFQDTFFKVVHTLRMQKYTEEGKFAAWVLRIAHNLIMDHFRKEKRIPTISNVSNNDGEEFDIFSILKIEQKNAEEEILGKQVRKDIRKLIEELPHEQRQVLMLRHYYDMTFKEISDFTNVSVNTSLGRMRYALINLRKLIEQKEIVLSF